MHDMNSTPCVKHRRLITICPCKTFRTLFICNCAWAVHAILVKRFCEIKQNDSSLNAKFNKSLDSTQSTATAQPVHKPSFRCFIISVPRLQEIHFSYLVLAWSVGQL